MVGRTNVTDDDLRVIQAMAKAREAARKKCLADVDHGILDQQALDSAVQYAGLKAFFDNMSMRPRLDVWIDENGENCGERTIELVHKEKLTESQIEGTQL